MWKKVNGLQFKGGQFPRIKTVAKNPILVQIDHVWRHMKGDGTESDKNIPSNLQRGS